MTKTILVLGAGTTGIITAHELVKGLSKDDRKNVKIVLFEMEEKKVFALSLSWLMVGLRKSSQAAIPSVEINEFIKD